MKCCNGHILSDTEPFSFLQRVSKSLKNWTISPVLQLCNSGEDSVCRCRLGIRAMQIVISERVRSLLQPAGESNSSKYQYVMLCLIRGQLPIGRARGWPVSSVSDVKWRRMIVSEMPWCHDDGSLLPLAAGHHEAGLPGAGAGGRPGAGPRPPGGAALPLHDVAVSLQYYF